jgi:predicted methyltransferase
MSRTRSPFRKLIALALGTLTLASATLHADHHGDDHAGLWGAITGPARSADNVRRDVYRKPLETLEFFGLKKDMTVLESWPGGGWYTEILAPYLAVDVLFIVV